MNAETSTRGQRLSPAQRKARALEIAAKRGGKVVAVVDRMNFREVNATEKRIAATLKERAGDALKRHGGRAA